MTMQGKTWASSTIVERYLSFFRAHDHLLLPGSPLVLPGNSTSFVIAGMQPLLPYLRGEVTPPSRKLTSLQRCLRSDDVDLVGTNGRKNTTFHMLGNWSIGSYSKVVAIEMALDLLLNHFELDRERLWVTVFSGDPELCLLEDEVTLNTWLRGSISGRHVVMLGSEDNLWTMGSHLGPCGPCTEIFYDRGLVYGCGKPDCQPGCSCERFLEIWNLVFMEYEFLPDGSISPLPVRNIDTGMGLERIAAVLQRADSYSSIDLFQPACECLQRLTPCTDEKGDSPDTRARRMIIDHLRATLLVGLEGVTPGRDGRNSVMRRLIRRASRQMRVLGIDTPMLSQLIIPLVEGHGDLITTQERQHVAEVVRIVNNEEKLFSRVLTIGLRYLEQVMSDQSGIISGEYLFKLHAEKGFPADLASEILEERGLRVDWGEYEKVTSVHRQVSRASTGAQIHNKR